MTTHTGPTRTKGTADRNVSGAAAAPHDVTTWSPRRGDLGVLRAGVLDASAAAAKRSYRLPRNLGGVELLSASRPELVSVFTGLTVAQFDQLVEAVAARGGDAVADGRPGRPWSLPLADRVLLIAVYYRTNRTMRQLVPLFGIKQAAVHRIIDRLGGHLALEQATPPSAGEVLIVEGTLVPTRDRAVGASSKNYRNSTNLQVLVHADSRLVLAVGDPQPGNRNDCTAYRASGVDQHTGKAHVLADGGYQGTGLLMPHRRHPGQAELPAGRRSPTPSIARSAPASSTSSPG